MENGFIYYIACYIIEGLENLNIVEWVKWIALRINPNKTDKKQELTYSRIAVDIFIILKFFFVIIMWCLGVTHWLVAVAVWYLIFMNLQTYFYYHVWCEDAVTSQHAYLHRLRRRFITLFLAIVFSNVAFAYLYACIYKDALIWGTDGAQFLQALWFSTSNSFAANYNVVNPNDPVTNAICIIQLIITFIFVTIIISRSIPQTTTP